MPALGQDILSQPSSTYPGAVSQLITIGVYAARGAYIVVRRVMRKIWPLNITNYRRLVQSPFHYRSILLAIKAEAASLSLNIPYWGGYVAGLVPGSSASVVGREGIRR